MNNNINIIKSFVKASCVKDILETKPAQLCNAKFNELKFISKDIFQNNKSEQWEIVGKVKIQKRNSNELVEANIKRLKKDKSIEIKLEHEGKTLISRDMLDLSWNKIKPTDLGYKEYKDYGLCLMYIFKYDAGEPFKGLAKIMDVLAVQESLKAGYKGHIYLDAIPNASPLHWARGFINTKYTKKESNIIIKTVNFFQKKKYDYNMKKWFNKYAKSRAKGVDTEMAKNTMDKKIIPHEKMALPESIIKQHIEEAKRIIYS